jgi:hypothetical protein
MHDDLIPATPADIAESLRYSLRFGSNGEPLGRGFREDPKLMAAWLAEHLRMSGFVLFRKPPSDNWAPGLCGERMTRRD